VIKMEKYYIKKGRRYIEAGYSMPDISTGLYFHQKTDYGSRTTSINYWVGVNPAEPVDISALIAIMSKDDRLARYLSALQDENSEEYKKAKEDCGDFVKGPLTMYNWSSQDLAACILRLLYEEFTGKNRQ